MRNRKITLDQLMSVVGINQRVIAKLISEWDSAHNKEEIAYNGDVMGFDCSNFAQFRNLKVINVKASDSKLYIYLDYDNK